MIRRLRGEDGIALITAVGVLAILTLLGVAAVAYSSSNSRSAEVSNAVSVAEHVAEAGVNQAMAVVANASDPLELGLLPDQTLTVPGGTVQVSGVLVGDTWTITGTSSVANPTGAGDLHRTVGTQLRVFLDPNAPGNEAWNYVYADDLTSCTTLINSVEVETPFYVRGDLCLENSAKVWNGPLRVAGKVTHENPQTSIGSASRRLLEAHIGGGCATGSGGPWVSPCGDAQRVYVQPPGADAEPGTITKPPVDLPGMYATAAPGPLHPCTTGSFPGGFDTDGTMNRSLPLSVNLMPALPYDCVVRSGPNVLGRIAWTGGSTGTLTIMGTIFFDGNIDLSNNAKATYQGRGVIYASGTIRLDNYTELCGVAACDRDSWDPNENLLIFVAGSSPGDGFTIGNHARLQGAVYAVGDYREENYVDMQGPVIANQLYYENNTEAIDWAPIWALIVGTPVNNPTPIVRQVAGSWTG